MGLLRHFRRNFLIFFITGLLVVSFQNCSGFNSKSRESSQQSDPTEGNGQGYDGKIRIVQHFDSTQKYWCKDQEVPESVLYQKSESDGWYYIKNYTIPCQSAPAVKVTGVIYDDSLKKATYLNKEYLAPKPIVVTSTEDTNFPDTNVYDGICQDENGLCSLRAAIEQASANINTSDVEVVVPGGLYKLSTPLVLHLPMSKDSHQLSIKGENQSNTLIDGLGLTNLLIIDGDSGVANISDITFQNASNTQGNLGSAITLTSLFYADLNIIRCRFDRNANSHDISAVLSSGNLNISQSQFTNNKTKSVAAIITFRTKLHIEDSIISNNAGFGVIVESRTYQVTINRTSIFDNGSIGVYFYECKECRIENSTIYRNQGGLFVTTVNPNPDPAYSINIINSTLVDNGTMGNINLTLAQPSTPLLLTNSVVANHNTAPNCASSSVIHPIVSLNPTKTESLSSGSFLS